MTLFTRARRFGKTLMMSMMENFFNIRKDSRSLFDGLRISKRKTFCKEWMNQYPVVFISFKDIEATTFDGAYKMLKTRLADLCKDLSPIFENAGIDEDDRQIFLRLKSKRADEDEVKNSLRSIMRMFYSVYGKQAILLIDEYDVPLAKVGEQDISDTHYYFSYGIAFFQKQAKVKK